MTNLPTRVDWHGNERPPSPMEMVRAEGVAARIRREVAEIRTAAEQLAGGNPFDAAVAEFLTVQATVLERAGSTAERAASMRQHEDTLEQPGMFPSQARSALLIARAHVGK
ncbi:hypothetical protein ABZ383_35470 [Streptomyces sp. NPDC005900]|uniref:hypothetical protein n=1 Tax=Streptomyces sp. NPDC005900 TaxID=3154569 RepID=UPI0033EB8AF6